MKTLKALILAFFATAFFAGCASNNSYDRSRSDAVPVSELGARGGQFAGQAQQFHQSNMAIDLCPEGTVEKVGSGSVNSGAGDQNGKVTYSVTTTSVAKSKCDFGAMNPKPVEQKQVKSAAYIAPPTGLTAKQDDVQATANKPTAKADKPARGTRQQAKEKP